MKSDIPAPFVCNETWLYLKKWPSGSRPIHSLQVEKRLSMTYYFCVPLYWLRWPWVVCQATARAGGSKLTCFSCRYPCARTHYNHVFVYFLVRNLTLWVPFPATNRQPCRKKSILAKVGFDAKGGSMWMRQNEFLFKNTAICTCFWAICS